MIDPRSSANARLRPEMTLRRACERLRSKCQCKISWQRPAVIIASIRRRRLRCVLSHWPGRSRVRWWRHFRRTASSSSCAATASARNWCADRRQISLSTCPAPPLRSRPRFREEAPCRRPPGPVSSFASFLPHVPSQAVKQLTRLNGFTSLAWLKGGLEGTSKGEIPGANPDADPRFGSIGGVSEALGCGGRGASGRAAERTVRQALRSARREQKQVN